MESSKRFVLTQVPSRVSFFQIVEDVERIGTVLDFHVTIGDFSAELVRLSVKADGKISL